MKVDNKKKPVNKFKVTFYIILVFFIFVYISGKTGYYETTVQKNTLITADAIKEFERDVEEGKPVDIKDYISAEVHDYRNSYSKLGFNISKTIDSFLNDGVEHLSRFIKALFT